MKAHIKRNAMPTTWRIKRKQVRFVMRPFPGSSFQFGIPMVVAMRDILHKGKSAKEVKTILLNNDVTVNGKKVKEIKYLIGLMDVLSIPKTKELFRLLINKKGELKLVDIPESEAGIFIGKIIKKNLVQGKCQLGVHTGRNILTDQKESYKIGDSIVFDKNKINDHLKLEVGSLVYLTGGKHIGYIASIKEIKNKTIICESGKDSFSVVKKDIFVVGKDNKTRISLLK